MHLQDDLIQDLASGLCADPEASAHLVSCDTCAQAMASWRPLFDGLAALPAYAPRTGFADRVMARVALPRPAVLALPIRVPARWLEAAAAAYAMIALALTTLGVLFRHEVAAALERAVGWALAGLPRVQGALESLAAVTIERVVPLVVRTYVEIGGGASLALLALLASLVPLSALVLYTQLRHTHPQPLPAMLSIPRIALAIVAFAFMPAFAGAQTVSPVEPAISVGIQVPTLPATLEAPVRSVRPISDRQDIRRLERRIQELERELERRSGHRRGNRAARAIGDVVGLAVTALLFAGAAWVAARLFPGTLARATRIARDEPGRSGLIGLAATFAWLPFYILVTIALIFTIVGIALVPFWLAAFPFLVVAIGLFGMIVGAQLVGERFWPEAEPDKARMRGLFVIFAPLAGATLLAALPGPGDLLVPLAALALFAVSAVGSGAALRALGERARRAEPAA